MSGFLPICSRFCPVLLSTWSCECAPLIGLKESGQFLFNGKKHKLTILPVGWIDPLQFLGTYVASHQFRSHWTTIKELKECLPDCCGLWWHMELMSGLNSRKRTRRPDITLTNMRLQWNQTESAIKAFFVNLQYMHILLSGPSHHILVPLHTFRWVFLAIWRWGILWAICLEAA